jgi:hypothetical protein
MTLESTKEGFFLAKFPFLDKIAKKRCVHKMLCMSCTAPDTTKTATLFTANDLNKTQMKLNYARYGLKNI